MSLKLNPFGKAKELIQNAMIIPADVLLSVIGNILDHQRWITYWEIQEKLEKN